jgi:UDP-N-acetylmuramate dehydrogenase
MPFTIREKISLRDLTTFRIGGPARFFCEVYSEDDLVQAISFAEETCEGRFFILGGGSNILVNDAGFSGLVIHIKISGMHFADDTSKIEARVIASVGAGEMWDAFVAESVRRALYGTENLSWIPGTVGAAPVQNIGAYGVEVASVIASVRAYDTEKKEFISFTNEACGFSYRDSIFKRAKNSRGQTKYVITQVSFILSKMSSLNMAYKDVQHFFEINKISPVSASLPDMRAAIISIRKNKLPDIAKVGTAGSFFKNPIISAKKYEELKSKYPELPGFPEKNGHIKVPLAWIIDKVCGYKGISKGSVGTFQNQALVIVNTGNASFVDVASFAAEIMEQVKIKTGIIIDPEVQYIQ